MGSAGAAAGRRLLRRHALAALGVAAAVVAAAAAAHGPLAAELGARAQTACDGGRPAPAQRLFGWALRLRREPALVLDAAACAQARGDFLTAERLLAPLPPPAAPALAARRWQLLGVNRFYGARAPEALRLLDRAVATAEGVDPLLAARARVDRARVLYHALGRGEEALADLGRAAAAGRTAGDRQLLADALRHAGAVHWWHRKEPTRARRERWEPALAIYRQIGDRRGEATTLSNLSHLHNENGDLVGFFQLQQRSLEIFTQLDDWVGIADCHQFLAGYHANLGDVGRERRHVMLALDYARRGGYDLVAVEAETHLGLLARGGGDVPQAIVHFHRALDFPAEPWLRKYRVGALAHAYLDNGEPLAARRWFSEALRLDRVGARPEIDHGLLLHLASTHARTGELDSARRLIAESEAAYRRRAEGDWSYELFHRRVLAELLAAEGETGRAIELLLATAEMETRVLASSGSDLLSAGGAEVYDRLLALLVAPRAGGPPEASRLRDLFAVLEQLRYRALRRLLLSYGDPRAPAARDPGEEETAARLAALSRRVRAGQDGTDLAALREEYRAYEDRILRAELSPDKLRLLADAVPVPLERVQATLDAGTALVVYLAAEGRLGALVVRRDSASTHPLPLTAGELAPRIRLLSTQLADSGEGDDWRAVAADLHERLLAPLEAAGALRGAERLGILPWGRLHEVPFAALLDSPGRGGRPLVERYALFFPPAVSFLARGARGVAAGPALALGRNQGGELGNLAAAEEEARRIATLLGGRALLGAAASEQALGREARAARILHVATHGLSEPFSPLLSRLELAPGGGEDGHVFVRDLLELGLHAELVTLSACQTARSFPARETSATELARLGLPEALLFGGSRRVLATLLVADDRSTLALMTAFYRSLPEAGAAGALAAAQRQLWRRTDTAHPRHWAGFVLHGEP